MDEKNGKIAHQRMVAGRRILRNLGRNNNSPGTPQEDECNGDFATVENTMKQALCHLRANHPAETTAPKCSQVFLD
jgi:hypothetical protein